MTSNRFDRSNEVIVRHSAGDVVKTTLVAGFAALFGYTVFLLGRLLVKFMGIIVLSVVAVVLCWALWEYIGLGSWGGNHFRQANPIYSVPCYYRNPCSAADNAKRLEAIHQWAILDRKGIDQPTPKLFPLTKDEEPLLNAGDDPIALGLEEPKLTGAKLQYYLAYQEAQRRAQRRAQEVAELERAAEEKKAADANADAAAYQDALEKLDPQEAQRRVDAAAADAAQGWHYAPNGRKVYVRLTTPTPSPVNGRDQSVGMPSPEWLREHQIIQRRIPTPQRWRRVTNSRSDADSPGRR